MLLKLKIFKKKSLQPVVTSFLLIVSAVVQNDIEPDEWLTTAK